MPHREPVFTGTCTALITPFDSFGAVNTARLADLIDEQLDSGVDALCVCGTTGETPTLSIREHLNAIEACCAHVNGRVPVLAGAGGNNTEAAVYLSRRAQEAGADALLLVTPYYNKTTQTGLIRHYEYIADRVDIPIVLYNVPSRTGLSFTAETYQTLAQDPRINGVKEASGNLALMARTRRLCGEDFTLWSGNDDQVVPMMALGAKGVVSAAANLIPRAMVRMSHLCLAEEFREAARLQLKFLPLLEALFLEVNPIPVKAAMNLLGKDVGGVRLPLCELSPEHQTVLKREMDALNLL